MHRSISKLFLASPALVLVMLLAAPTAQAQNTVAIQGGSTVVALSHSFLASLASIKRDGVGPGEKVKDSLVFPVTGGAVDLDSASGEVLHAGGFRLTAGNTNVELLDLMIDDAGGSPAITALVVVNGKLSGRVTLFDLTVPPITTPMAPEHSMIHVDGIAVALDPAGAAALGGAFTGVTFTAGESVGTAEVTLLLAHVEDKK